ncbi:MAG: SAM-dependent chlorinase/fluorinase [Chitinophagales bacterium]
MPVITLTTDLGSRDHYAAVVKGELLKSVPDALLVDISHDIAAYNIMHGSFVLKNSYRHFPIGTYHLIGVNMNSEVNMSHLVVFKDHYIFVGPDNGIFGLLWDGEPPEKIFQLQPTKEEMQSTLPLKDLYVRAVKHLAGGGKPEDIGQKVSSLRQSAMGLPIISPSFIRASIIYFDRFENAIVNIRKDEFERIQQNRSYVLHFKKYDDIGIISENYFDVPESEKLCLFNSSGYLEIAINKGNAMGLLNLNIGDIVQVEFK